MSNVCVITESIVPGCTMPAVNTKRGAGGVTPSSDPTTFTNLGTMGWVVGVSGSTEGGVLEDMVKVMQHEGVVDVALQ